MARSALSEALFSRRSRPSSRKRRSAPCCRTAYPSAERSSPRVSLTLAYSTSAHAKNASTSGRLSRSRSALRRAGGSSFHALSSSKSLWIRHSPSRGPVLSDRGLVELAPGVAPAIDLVAELVVVGGEGWVGLAEEYVV